MEAGVGKRGGRVQSVGGRWRPSWLRAAGVAAVGAPLLMWAEFIGYGLARPGYSLITRAASDLGARGTTNATPFTIGFFYVPGLLTALLGVGLWRARPAGSVWRTGSTLVVVEGLLLMLMGALSEDPASTAATALHQRVASAGFTAATLAPLVLAWSAPANVALRTPRCLWVCSGVILAAIQVTGIMIGAISPLPPGLVQRPYGVALTCWFVGTGVWLLRLPRESMRRGSP